MTTYVALLRGINVGGNNKVDMKQLKQLFEKYGFSQVSTYINSGNILFSSSEKNREKLTSFIEGIIQKKFGFPVKTLLRTKAEIKKVADTLPTSWMNDAHQRTEILFLWENYDKKSSLKLLTINPEVDHLQYISGAIAWNFERKQYKKSGIHKFIGSTLYKHMTARNINTVRKLASLLDK